METTTEKIKKGEKMIEECSFCDSEGWIEYNEVEDRYKYCPFCDNDPDMIALNKLKEKK
tara:strand:+ start:1177 stop:1353 length:177 start_codon:yes stop_codon:yes gene_type:complete